MASICHSTMAHPFGIIRGKEEAMERIFKQAAEKDDDQNPERSVVTRAIAMASDSMGLEKTTIRDGKVDMPEYDLANGYDSPDATWHRDQGWAVDLVEMGACTVKAT